MTLIDQPFKLETRKFIKQSVILFFIGGIAMTLLFGRFMGVYDFWSFIRIGSFQGFTWVILWMGNGMLSDYMNSKYSWLDQTEKRLVLGILLTVGYTLGALIIYLIVWMSLVRGLSWDNVLGIFDFGFFAVALLITALISMFLHGRSFLKEWKESASEAERLKNENLAARYETLKNQVNPHFLFNSFNVLSTLVYKDQEMAVKFIKQMSNLYRYVLETKDKETVSIKEEVTALNSFAYLSSIRFGDNIDFQVDLDEIADSQIPPMTLQMLAENAIKHNVVSKAKPLSIKIYYKEEGIIVQNNLQRKNSVSSSTGIGLPNIQARYEYLSDKGVSILETNEHFIVKIPLLTL